jgi:hypothetical protein
MGTTSSIFFVQNKQTAVIDAVPAKNNAIQIKRPATAISVAPSNEEKASTTADRSWGPNASMPV